MFGVTVAYKLNGFGGGTAIQAVIDLGFGEVLNETDEIDFSTRVIEVLASDVASPTMQGRGTPDEVILPGDARTWYVRRVLSSDGGVWRLEIADTLAPFID
jgi:hypothetical protein